MENQDNQPRAINGEVAIRILHALIMGQPDASARCGFIGEALASVICNLPEADWKAILTDSQQPCGAPETGCQCQVLKDVFTALDVMRKKLPTPQEMKAKEAGMPPPGLSVFTRGPLEA